MTLAKSDSRRHFLGMRDVFVATAIAALGFSATFAAGQSNTQKPAAAAQTSADRHLAADSRAREIEKVDHELMDALGGVDDAVAHLARLRAVEVLVAQQFAGHDDR